MKTLGTVWLGIIALLLPGLALASPWLGIRLDAGQRGGPKVGSVVRGSPGEKAGIAAGDEILTLDDHATPSPAELVARVETGKTGQRVVLGVVDAAGHTRKVSLTYVERPDREKLQHDTLIGDTAPDFQPAVRSGGKL